MLGSGGAACRGHERGRDVMEIAIGSPYDYQNGNYYVRSDHGDLSDGPTIRRLDRWHFHGEQLCMLIGSPTPVRTISTRWAAIPRWFDYNGDGLMDSDIQYRLVLLRRYTLTMVSTAG
ncbi:MAG: hypothetical protein MZU91_13320 [Desulfosudis oleivorans]|nr:hypothetical protein [Desulfosudis oleivorans]